MDAPSILKIAKYNNRSNLFVIGFTFCLSYYYFYSGNPLYNGENDKKNKNKKIDDDEYLLEENISEVGAD